MQVVDVEKICLADNPLESAEPVVEIPVLLESDLLTALEAVACERRLSAGCIVRQLIREFLSSLDS